MTTSQSRKQRRAAANGHAKPSTVDEIPLAQPDRSGPQAPTLYDIAAEREASLRAQIPALEAKRRKEREAQAQAQAKESSATAEPSAPTQEDAVFTALLYGITLTTLHLTLDILVWQQYAQDPSWSFLFKRNLKNTLPLAILLVYVFHAPFFGLVKFEWLRQGIFFCASVAAGIYAWMLSLDASYLAVMKKVPPSVTLVLWAVMEMRLAPAVGSVAGIAVGVWWLGGKAF